MPRDAVPKLHTNAEVADHVSEAGTVAYRRGVEAAIAAVRKRCTVCSGDGGYGDGSGEEAACEYCGRPIDNIRKATGVQP